MRIKRFDMTPELLKSFFDGKRRDMQATKNALPVDAELVNIAINQYESTPRIISLFYTSPSFPNLPEGSTLEPETIWFTKYYKTEGES